MSKNFDWEKVRTEERVRTQGNQLVDDLFETEFERIVQVEETQTFSNLETAWKERTEANDRANKDLINFVVDSLVAGEWKSVKVPRTITADVMKVVESLGGLIKWAEAQPDFKKLYEKKLLKRAKQLLKKNH